MARSQVRHNVKDAAGNVVQNALCYVYETGTTTPVADLFAASSGGSALPSLTSDAQGDIVGWLDVARTVDVKVTDNSNTAYYPSTSSRLLSWTDFTESVEIAPTQGAVDASAAAEAALRASADTSEATTRATADTTNASAITAEATARAAADTAHNINAGAHTNLPYVPVGIPTTVTPAVVGDYTGRIGGTTGTGTDARAAIQAALTAASSLVGASYFDYLTRRSYTVKLPSGDYWISNPNTGSPSLVVPPGVTLDASDATLYFDYPAAATLNWCGIKVGQYANLIVGKIANSSKVAAPDTKSVYDAVRMVMTDNHSYVVGYKDSEINGFQGAAVRGIGAWITYVKGLRIASCHYGVVASHVGTGFNYVDSGGNTQAGTRFATDLWIEDCIVANCRKGGLLAGVTGDSADINAVGFLTYGGVVGIINSTLENIGSYAAYVVNASSVSILNSHIEESGGADAVMIFDTVRVVTINNLQYNHTGRSITLANGTTGNQSPTDFIRAPNSQVLIVDGAYIHNTFVVGMNFASTTTNSSYHVRGVYADSNAFSGSGAVPITGTTTSYAIKGTYNGAHHIIGTVHEWDDGTGLLRRKAGIPASATDGTPGIPDLGFPFTVDPRFVLSTVVTISAANRGWYMRTLTGGTISKIAVEIGTSSGNICVAVFAASGTGQAAVPAARLATSGSVASPGTGYREISLGGSVYVPAGSFIYIGADNNTVTFAAITGGYSDSMGLGFGFREDTFPAGTNAGTLTASASRVLLAVGVA